MAKKSLGKGRATKAQIKKFAAMEKRERWERKFRLDCDREFMKLFPECGKPTYRGTARTRKARASRKS